jgi:hypothetical protein
MIHRIFKGSFWLTGVACATVAIATAAQAGHIRYVSTAGSNANPCTLAQPCKTLQRGINQTPARDELRILDSGDYGTNGSIKKSIMISGNGHTVSIVNPLTIDDAGATVILRGLTLDGRNSTGLGIEVLAAAAVQLERCVVQGFPTHGIRFIAANSNLSLTNSTVSNNDGHGLTVASNTATLTVDNSLFQNNTSHGMIISGVNVALSRTVIARNGARRVVLVSTARVAVAQSVVAHNGGHGIDSAGTRLTIDSSVVHNNSSGVIAQPNSTVVIANSAFTNNIYGIQNNGGTILTRGNNTASGNTNSDVVGILIPLGGV